MENKKELQEKQLSSIIMDGDEIIETSSEVVISENTECQKEKFYVNVENYKNTLSLRMREKAMITIPLYNNIINALKQKKSGKTTGINAQFHLWCRKHFKIDCSAGTELLCSSKNGNRIAVVENYYQILQEAHVKIGHGGRDKMRHEVMQHYIWIPSKIIDTFLTTCVSCQVRRPIKSHVIPTAIVSLGFMTRLQMDLIDMRTRPDGEFKWILHCRDHFTKFSWAYALPSKEARYVAENLIQLFFQFGPSHILQSDNGKEFTAQVIKNLKIMWPGLVILNGRPRHPQSQGLVERGNSTLCDILGKFMQDRDTNHWVSCLLQATYSMNTSLAQGIKHTPFEVVFGQKPRLNMTLWQSISDQGIEDEEDLPPSIRNQLEQSSDLNAPEDEIPVVTGPSNNLPADQQRGLDSSVQSDDLTQDRNIQENTFCESNIENLGLPGFPHNDIRSKAADVYLARTTRQQLAHKIHIQSLNDKCNIGDFVGLRIDKVDRTNTDPKLLPCVIIAKEEEKVKLACVYGVINQWWSFTSLVGLSAVPHELTHLKPGDLQEISMITASKLYVRGAVNGICCSCKGGCKTKQCACKRNQVFCSTKCHKNTSCCKNMEN
ncbi:unnamed protein product [Rotaria socialis]|uniref:Integrase catalytic domain-containing protein n=3 Tax=Rotaria socialis TaxID=392032 RepID=A0A821WEQ7_9BILA|nr:unnamed protein product [Rotaria socialis]CAF4925620.1 unnamed protein product [Rotaria socialis]